MNILVFLIKIYLIIQRILPYTTEFTVLKKFFERGPGSVAVMFNKKKVTFSMFLLTEKINVIRNLNLSNV